jgi:hypothetical protein
MSALPPKVDIPRRQVDVRFGSEPDIARGNLRNHQHDLFDAARGLFDQVGH